MGLIPILPKMNEKIRLNYYDISGRLVFVPFSCPFLEVFEDTKKTFLHQLTFSVPKLFSGDHIFFIIKFGSKVDLSLVHTYHQEYYLNKFYEEKVMIRKRNISTLK